MERLNPHRFMNITEPFLSDADIDEILAYPGYSEYQRSFYWPAFRSFTDTLPQDQLSKLLLDPRTTRWGVRNNDGDNYRYTVFWDWSKTVLSTVVKYPEILPQFLKDPRCGTEFKLKCLPAAAKLENKSLLMILEEPDVREYFSRSHETGEYVCPIPDMINYSPESRGLEIIAADSEFQICPYILHKADTKSKLWYIAKSRAIEEEFGKK